ncbi:MAG: PDZ domain-containing protein, partial [Acidobacteria bacterium]|nr:PDZ domain-containing protein [Acidobacteriota bacterium]
TEGDADVDEDESAPAERLRTYMQDKVKEGDAVALEIKRGSEIKTVTVTARAIAGPQTRTFVFRGEGKHFDIDIPEPPELDELGALENLDVQVFTSGWRELDLAAMNAELGEYFGIGAGVLVVRAGEGGALQLKGGDVILRIGDRVPKSPAQTLRILRSYEAGDTISIEVMRKKARMTVQGTIPARKTGSWVTREAPPPPAPPAALRPAMAPRAAAPVSQPAPATAPHGGNASL